ncbi:MAG: VOC family protein [Eubacteriales bacterium]|nr:VOC family protein [Eubacteriales bacterium]
MRFSHILYKVKDKEEACRDFEAMGFTISRGGVNPKIWFEDGSFIELFDMKISKLILSLMRLLGMKDIANKFQHYQDADYGFMDFSLEVDGFDLEHENSMLRQMGYSFCSKLMKKKDPITGAKLRWRSTFVEDLKFPFLVATGNFMNHAKPAVIAHRNGATRLNRVVWGADQKHRQDIRALCDDPRLELVEGDGFQSIDIEGFPGTVFQRMYYK